MGEQLKSDSLPLPLSLSNRAVIELPAGVRPTGEWSGGLGGGYIHDSAALHPRGTLTGEVIP